MKKIFTLSVIALISVAMLAAERVVWTGTKAISWNAEVFAGEQFETPDGTFSGLAKDEVIKVAVEAKIDEPQYVMTYKAGTDWTWTDLEGVSVAEGIMSYTVATDEIATFIAERGIVFRGQGYVMTQISIVTADVTPEPQPSAGEVTLFEGEKVLGAAGEDNLGIEAAKFANLSAKDSIAVTIKDMTDTYCQLNIAANTGWVVVPGTNWESLTAAGRYAYAITDADLISAIKDGGITIQGKLCTITKVTLSPYVEQGDNPNPPAEDKKFVDTEVWTGDVAISWNQEVYAGSELDTYTVKQDMFAGLAEGDSIKVYYTGAIDGAQFNLTYKAGDDWVWTELTISEGSGFFAYKVASEQIAQEIADRGLVIRGQGYHAVRIVVGQPETTTSVVETFSNQQSVLSTLRFNILGQPVDEHYKGIVIMNGKKFYQQ
ncbi:MAG: hypothetical protein IJT12_09560 [Paludibacteraceae bacterium]|nr:hypothetical protein [Paludibacteraceae bacterium]